jgi:osmotically inducible protein OsmC
MSIDVKYRTSATTTGGRDGGVRSEDGHLQAKLSTPKELGGAGGEGTNPEQLFAAGYSACFLSALKFAGHQMKVQLPQDVSVKATIGVGPRKEGGFGLAADLAIDIPGIDRHIAQSIVDAAHKTCPYSNATRNNIDTTTTLM